MQHIHRAYGLPSHLVRFPHISLRNQQSRNLAYTRRDRSIQTINITGPVVLRPLLSNWYLLATKSREERILAAATPPIVIMTSRSTVQYLQEKVPFNYPIVPLV
ncbi:hypothetical protein HZ326_8644 [Fusarium oxysporum f. sp. albedinis]|nr:hypothetical protein HZ326_8644 [Fusarium oxysporum f. sp. albedinis]